jgi:hypothetical protein
VRKIIEVEKLIVNPKNYRFDPVETQAEAIDLMLDKKGDELVNLANHIVTYGLDEAKNFRVTEVKKDLYKVLEGNRRITTIKCLNNPSLIKGDSLRNKFIKLMEDAKKNGKTIPTQVHCFVYKTEEEAAPFIKLDHTGKNEGAGLDQWGVAEKNRFDYDFGGKLSPAMQAVELYKKETKSKIDDPNELKLSTINRILSNPESRSYLGLGMINEEIYPIAQTKEVVARLDKLFNKMITDDVPVSELYNAELIVKFMKNLFGEKPKLSKRAVTIAPKKGKTRNKLKKVLPKSSGRGVLIPDTCRLVIKSQKINNIYHELMEIPLNDFTNATGVLFRVFLEVSIDEYATKNGINFTSETKLSSKISQVTEKLEKENIASKDQLKYIRKVGTQGNAILSVDHFNEYVHSSKVQPLPVDMINTWDNLQEFFEILWEEISKKDKNKK